MANNDGFAVIKHIGNDLLGTQGPFNGPLATLMFSVAGLIAIYYSYRSLVVLYQTGDISQNKQSIFVVFIYLLSGVLLLQLDDFILATSKTVFDADFILSYKDSSISKGFGANYSQAAQGSLSILFGFIRVLGAFAVIKGIMTLPKAAEKSDPQRYTYSKGFIYIIAGVMLVNIFTVLEYIENSFIIK